MGLTFFDGNCRSNINIIKKKGLHTMNNNNDTIINDNATSTNVSDANAVDVNIPDANASDAMTEEQLQELTDEQLMDLFCEQMLIDKGLNDLQGQAREDVRNEVKENLVTEINRSILAALPDDKFDELSRKMEAGELTEDDLAKAVTEAGLDIDDITEKTMLKFRELYLQGGEEVKTEE